MAVGPITQVSDIVVPDIFNPYLQQVTEQKSRLIQSGAVVRSEQLDMALEGGGLTFEVPSMRDLDNDADNVASDEADDFYTGGSDNSTPRRLRSSRETAVRLSRNQSWSSADLAADLAGHDPMASIANRIGYYWSRRLQTAFVATINGVFADNDAAPVGSEHVQGDLSNDVSGVAYAAGVTDFSAPAFIDAAVTMGDSMEVLSMVMVHSIVYARMQKNNLIDFIPDSEGLVNIPTFLGRQVIVDDGVPNPESGVYHTWIFGEGAVLLGMGSPKVPTEVARLPDAGNGAGQEVLFNRTEWIIHPVGHRYDGNAPNGGPSNGTGVNQLAHEDSWRRAYNDRKQIHIARLITREF